MSKPAGETYAPQERVLCYHGPLIYEAKILRAETWTPENTKLGTTGDHYFVHYKGWKQTWDEWVPQDRLLKFNEQNQARQKTLAAQYKAGTTKSASAPTTKETKDKDGATASGTGGTTGRRKEITRKRGREEDDSSKKPEMKLEIPDALKVILVDDWEAVTKNNQLVPLPREPSVQKILEEFADHVKAMEKQPLFSDTILSTMISGMQLYFERSIGTNLLYRFERGQFAEARKKYVTGQHVTVGKEMSMSEVYGAEHLLRLIVHLPSMIAQTTLDPPSVALLKEYVTELMNFMVLNKPRLFLTEYETTSSHYLGLMRA
ncbi:Esa1p-associated factor [Tulasnella sp. 419]|nr:Esa1p-associated factor [Tulasnella sp. 418]KAG8965720.1 Esa1p-associated factor [Tulasnella sp. 419]